MGWYDVFAKFYDSSLEPLYLDARRSAAAALRAGGATTVLDVPCGTGQSLDVLAPPPGSAGRVLGVDVSEGMLGRAGARVASKALSNVTLAHASVHTVDATFLTARLGRPDVDRIHIFLGLTAFPDWERAFETLWSVLAPGGRLVIVDVHDPRPGFQGHMVNLVARADIRRRVWEPLERVASRFERVPLPSLPQHGGQLFLASGDKPAVPAGGQ